MKIRLAFLFVAISVAFAAQAGEMKKDHIMLSPSDMVWTAGPPSLPAGGKLSVIEGDPSKPGPFTMRFKLPAGYKIPPHFHPQIEHVTVLEGTMAMGLGETWSEKALHSMGVGSFMVMDIGTRHFFMAKTAGQIQIHGIGPWGITYVNPADDPRSKDAANAKR